MNNNLKRTSVWLPLFLAIAFCAGLFVGSFYFPRFSGSEAQSKIDAIMSHISEEYVDEVNTDSLLEASIPDILAKLDPHTTYISSQDLQSVNEELEGSFCGIGISFNMLTDTITVLEVISGGPSEKVGLMAGDRIISINDTVVAGQKWSNEKVISHLRGERDTEVTLGVMRSTSPKLLKFKVVRGDIPVTSIDATYLLSDGTGYIKVNKFGRNTYSEFLNSMVELRDKGAQRYMIDLRGNGGGYMEPAILMANEFLEAGRPIVETRGRTDISETSAVSDGTGAFTQYPLVVVIDEFSASASEIFAGAIQDNDRGVVVGRRSFGKGLVQRQIELPDHSAIRLTTARYYTPSGRCIQKIYTPGALKSYDMEIVDRYNNGEIFSADSVHLDKTKEFLTLGGRTVYGGGGIMPDVFVPNDTTGLSTYYLNVLNAGLMQKYAFHYTDRERERLLKASSTAELLKLLPSDDTLLQDFANFARDTEGIAPRWYYINISRNLIVSQLKALIARDLLGTSSFYEVYNDFDPMILRANKEFSTQIIDLPKD